MNKKEFRLIHLNDTRPVLSQEELKNINNSFEWYYFDFENTEYNIVVIFAIKDPLADATRPNMWIEISNKQSTQTTKYNLLFDNSTIKTNNNEVLIKFDEGNSVQFSGINGDQPIKNIDIIMKNQVLNGSINISPIGQGFCIKNQEKSDGYYIKNKKEYISGAIFTIPFYKAEINMNYCINDVSIKGNFEGYSDHPFGSECLSLTHKSWTWGRFINEDYVIQYSNVEAFKGYESDFNYVYILDRKSEEYNITGDVSYSNFQDYQRKNFLSVRYPRQYEMEIPEFKKIKTMKVASHQSIMNIPVYNRSKAEIELNGDKGAEIGKMQGWTEFVNIPQSLRRIMMQVSKKIHRKNTIDEGKSHQMPDKKHKISNALKLFLATLCLNLLILPFTKSMDILNYSIKIMTILYCLISVLQMIKIYRIKPSSNKIFIMTLFLSIGFTPLLFMIYSLSEIQFMLIYLINLGFGVLTGISLCLLTFDIFLNEHVKNAKILQRAYIIITVSIEPLSIIMYILNLEDILMFLLFIYMIMMFLLYSILLYNSIKLYKKIKKEPLARSLLNMILVIVFLFAFLLYGIYSIDLEGNISVIDESINGIILFIAVDFAYLSFIKPNK
ncbi:MAG: hypothetical protein GF364_19510 [Candidatus Lokiarchaeota archaeon]|nr:hypothetical protein [Candidatus Lokiarchaeota archaeon]